MGTDAPRRTTATLGSKKALHRSKDVPEQYEDAVRRLNKQGYDVHPHEQGYLVQHRTDGNDISRIRHLSELIELADLFDWREQRQRHLKFVTT
jgi:hypothetical protein